MNVLTLKVGDKYGPEYINRLYSAIKRNSTVDFDFYCYTEDSSGLDDNIHIIPLRLRHDVVKQWYKIDFHHMPKLHGKCLILDIDYIIIDNIDDILTWNLPKNTLGCQERWWSNRIDYCRINGGFQMFHQGDTKHLYDTFYKDPEYWQRYYVDRGEAEGPVNGEQNFVDNHCPLDRSWLPSEWFAKYQENELSKIQGLWSERINSNDPFFMAGEFNENIKMVHFSNANNAMHQYNDDWIEEYWYD